MAALGAGRQTGVLRTFHFLLTHKPRPVSAVCKALGGRVDDSVSKPLDHAGEIVSAIISVLEFGEISRRMFAVDGPVGADERGLDVPKGCVDPSEHRVTRGFGTASGDACLVRTSGIGNPMKAGQPIADHIAGGIETAQRET